VQPEGCFSNVLLPINKSRAELPQIRGKYHGLLAAQVAKDLLQKEVDVVYVSVYLRDRGIDVKEPILRD
jgi:ribose 1,5-bisphosphokinase PhnN